MLCTSVSNDVPQSCKHAWKHTMIQYDDTLYCTIPGAGLQWVWRKNSFLGAWAERQRKKGNPAKSAAFKAGKKPKRQRKRGKTPKSVAFPPRSRGKRQRKKGKTPKSVAFPPTSPSPTTLHSQAPINSPNHSSRNEKNMLS